MAGNRLDEHSVPFLEWCDQNNIPVATAAGNQPTTANLQEGTPQHFGTASNNIITVGAVKQDGTLWPDTAVPMAGMLGSMTIFAPGEDIGVLTMGGQIPNSINSRPGTSHAAALTVSNHKCC